MQMNSLQELLKKCTEWGFDLASVSIATQLPEEELKRLCSSSDYALKDKDKVEYLMVFLMQLCYERPENDGHYRAMLESLMQYFKIPPEAIANYTGVGVDELLSFESSRDKDRIEKYIAHLFSTFIRDPRYSV